MSRGVNVISFRTLEELDLALARFASESEAALQSIGPEINRKLELLRARREQCEHEVEYWQQAYDDADPEEDDISYISYRLAEAADRLANVSHWQSRVDESHEAYAREGRRFVETVIDECPKARGFVRQKLSELQEYISLKPDGSAAPFGLDVGSGIGPPATNDSPSPASEAPLEAITELLLPQGFSWIRLDSIEPSELNDLQQLRSKNDLTSEDLKGGLEILRKEILPQIKLHGSGAGSDYFWKLGQGRSGTNSLQGVYDAFFGSEPIWVDRFIGQQHFRIGNGRHRIKAAHEMGWPAVPARIMQASLRKSGA
jgi:hypothetical protein